MSLVVLVGNPRSGSRTRTAAVAAARAVQGDLTEPAVVDLADLGPQVLEADASPALKEAVELVTSASVLVVASPTYKGTYTGLLKSFLDRLPGRSLTGVTALPLLVMGAPHHALAVEVHLRPLLVELGATVPTPGLALLESQLEEPGEVLSEWAAQVAPALAPAPRRTP